MKTLLIILLFLVSSSNIGCATMKKFGKAYGEETRKEEAKQVNCTGHIYGDNLTANCH